MYFYCPSNCILSLYEARRLMKVTLNATISCDLEGVEEKVTM